MTSKEQVELFEKFTEKQKSIFVSKADDYAGKEDRLNNFKVVGASCGLAPEMACLTLIATKVARLGSLLKDGRVPNNESIDDSILDLANYTFLLQCIRSEYELPSSIGSEPGVLIRAGDIVMIEGGWASNYGLIGGHEYTVAFVNNGNVWLKGVAGPLPANIFELKKRGIKWD